MRGTPRGAVDLAAISEAWDLMKSNWSNLAVAMLLAAIVNWAINFVVSLPFAVSQAVIQEKGADIPAILMVQLPGLAVQTVVSSVLQGLMLGGMAHMTLGVLRGEAVTINTFFRVFQRAHLFMVYGLVATLLTYLGLLGCLVGALVVGGLLMLSPMYMVDKEMGPWEAITASFNALKSEWLMASVFYLVAGVVAFIGILACGVGILFTAPLAMLATTIVYRDIAYVGAGYTPPSPMTAPGPAGPPPSEAPMSPPTDDEPPSPPAP